ncbi:MAG: pyridoxamine 5'-phosphate oxidase family protein [Polymorphobacter sp.]
MTDASPTDNLHRIWKAAAGIRTAMLVTRGETRLSGRPMSAIVRADENAIWFLTDVPGDLLDDIAAHPQVSVTFCDGGSTHVAFDGSASIHADRATIEGLWSQPAQAYYPEGPGDPRVRAVRVRPVHAELWDGPGTIVAMAKMAAALVSKKSVDGIGEHVEANI